MKKHSIKQLTCEGITFCAAVTFFLTGMTASAQVTTDIVGFSTITCQPGFNGISMGFVETLQGGESAVIASISGDVLTLQNNLINTYDNTFYAITVGDAGATNNEGQWAEIGSGTSGTTALTLIAGTGSGFEAGDRVEIRKYRTITDVFGTGASVVLQNENSNVFSAKSADYILVWNPGVGGFATVFYHNGSMQPEGWYSAGTPADNNPLAPDAVVFVNNSGGTPFDITFTGRVSETTVTHYDSAPGGGQSGVGLSNMADVTFDDSGIQNVIAVNTNVLGPKSSDYVLKWDIGSQAFFTYFYHDGSMQPLGWYSGGAAAGTDVLGNNTIIFIVKAGSGFAWQGPTGM